MNVPRENNRIIAEIDAKVKSRLDKQLGLIEQLLIRYTVIPDPMLDSQNITVVSSDKPEFTEDELQSLLTGHATGTVKVEAESKPKRKRKVKVTTETE